MLGEEIVDCGGYEGTKSRFRMQMIDSDKPDDVEEYFAKKFDSERDALQTVEKFEKLRERGYNVPPEVYYLCRNGKHYVVMTDLSEGGVIPVWGTNDSPTESENDALVRIQPTRDEMNAAILPMAKRLDRDNCMIARDVWVMRRFSTGELQAFLVDITSLKFTRDRGLSEDICHIRSLRFIETTLGELDDLMGE